MRTALILFFSSFFSVADARKECLSIPTFKLPDHEVGQCQPSKHPGAFYTEENQVMEWECLDPDQAIDAEAETMAQTKGFAGVCTFAAYGSSTTPEEVPPCSAFLDHNPPVCHPGPKEYWGACVTPISEEWKCIPKDDAELVAGVAKGDCKFYAVHGDRENNRYNDVCRFEFDKPFKCPTVPTYDANGTSTCSSLSEEGEEVHPSRSACFSLAEGTRWSCRADVQESSSCSWTYSTAMIKRLFLRQRLYYDGLCLFPGSPGYDAAADWGAVPLWQRLEFVLVLLIFAAGGGGGLFYCRRAKGARQQPLIGAGSEMSASSNAAENKQGQYLAD